MFRQDNVEQITCGQSPLIIIGTRLFQKAWFLILFIEGVAMFRYTMWGILILLLSYTMSFAHESGLGNYVVKAYRLDNIPPPEIDGKLDDEAWKKATPVRGFIQKEPDRGKPATDDTEAYVVYDRHNLYLGFRCYDKEPGKIINYIARSGESYLSDTIKVILDPYHDHRTGYGFEISPGGLKRIPTATTILNAMGVGMESGGAKEISMKRDGRRSLKFLSQISVLRIKNIRYGESTLNA